MARFLIVSLGVVFLLTACAPPEQKHRVVWPLPPERPRLEWIGNYNGQESFPKSRGKKALESMVGGKQDLTTFDGPYGIVSNGAGIVYVVDQFQQQIWVYDFNLQKTTPFSKGPIFSRPSVLDVDRAGNLYVSDTGSGKILVFSPARKLLRSIGSPEELKWPVFFALNEENGRIYISDVPQHRIVMYSMEGDFIGSFGTRGVNGGEFNYPQGVAVNAAGEVFVADSMNARIQVFTAEGEFVRMFGSRGDQPYQFEFPKSLDFDSDGNLWITDSRRPKIYTYTPEGKLLLETGSARRSTDALGFGMPVVINIDRNDRIYISDSTNKRFSVYQYMNDAYLQANPLSEADIEFLMGLTNPEE